MKASGKTKVLMATPLMIARPNEEIIIVEPLTKISMVPYVVVVQVQPVKEKPRQEKMTN